MQTSLTPFRIHKSDIKRSLLIKMDIWGFTHYFTSCNVTTVHTSNLSSSQRWSCSSYGVFFELTKVESSDQEGNDTQVSFNTYTNSTTKKHHKKNHQQFEKEKNSCHILKTCVPPCTGRSVHCI